MCDPEASKFAWFYANNYKNVNQFSVFVERSLGSEKKLMDFHWELSCGIINVLFLNSSRTSKNVLKSSIFTYYVQSVSGRTEKTSQCVLHILYPQFPQMLFDLFYKRTYTKVFAILRLPTFLSFIFSVS